MKEPAASAAPLYVQVTPLGEPGAYDFRSIPVRLDPARVVAIDGALFVHVAHLKENNP